MNYARNAVGGRNMHRTTFALLFLLMMFTVGTSARAQEEQLDFELAELTESLGTIEAQYDRVLEGLGLSGGLDALELDQETVRELFSTTATFLESRTRGRGSALVEFFRGIDILSEIRSALRSTIPALIDSFRQWLSEGGDEEIIRSIRIDIRKVNAILVEIRARLMHVQAVLDDIESQLENL